MTESQQEFYQQLEELYSHASYEEIETFLQKELRASASGCVSCFNPAEITICTELGILYRNNGRCEKAVTSFNRAKQLAYAYLGTASTEYAMILNNLAICYRLSGRLNEALDLFRECREIYNHSIGRNNSLYCSLLNNIALTYYKQNRIQDAEHELLEALDIAKSLPDSKVDYDITSKNLDILHASQHH